MAVAFDILCIIALLAAARWLSVKLFAGPAARTVCFLIILGCAWGVNKTLVKSARAADKQQIEARLLTISAYQAIKEKSPEDFNRLVEDVKMQMTEGKSQDFILKEAGKKIRTLHLRYLPYADDHSVVELMKSMNLMVQGVKERHGGEACYYTLHPTQAPQSLPEYETKAELDDLSDKTAAMIRSYQAGRPLPDQKDIEPMLNGLFQRMEQKFSLQDVTLLNRPWLAATAGERAKVCEMTLAFNRDVLNQYEKDAAAFWRLTVHGIQQASSQPFSQSR